MTTCIRRSNTFMTACKCKPCVDDVRRKRSMLRQGALSNSGVRDKARDRLIRWDEAGYSVNWIASATGCNRFTLVAILRDLREGWNTRPGVGTARAIVAADIRSATEGWTPALSTERRLQALTAIGWTLDTISTQAGIPRATLATARRGGCTRVTAKTFRAVRAVYARLENTDGGNDLSRHYARKRLWAPPAAWDDIETDWAPVGLTPVKAAVDEPADPIVVSGVLNGRWRMPANRNERIAISHAWAAAGRSLALLEEFTGWSAQHYSTKVSVA